MSATEQGRLFIGEELRHPRVLLSGATTDSPLAESLRDSGHRVVCVDDAESCVFKALQKDFEAILVDEDTLGARAAELCESLRGIRRYETTPLLVVMSPGSTADLERLRRAGVDDIVYKPTRAVALKMRLRSHLQRMRMLSREQALSSNLGRYVSWRTLETVKRMTSTGVAPVPEQRDVCVMFADVRGSTALGQETDLTTLFSMLSRLLAAQVECVHRHDGFVDKFGGDGIMAVFDGPDMAAHACRCALEIAESVRHGPTERDGPPILPVGIGLHLGDVLIGNIGSNEHLDFSVIGETVNLAARLCGEADAGLVLVSAQVRAAAHEVPGLDFGPGEEHRIRGIRDAVVAHPLRVAAGLDRRGEWSGPDRLDFDRR